MILPITGEKVGQRQTIPTQKPPLTPLSGGFAFLGTHYYFWYPYLLSSIVLIVFAWMTRGTDHPLEHGPPWPWPNCPALASLQGETCSGRLHQNHVVPVNELIVFDITKALRN